MSLSADHLHTLNTLRTRLAQLSESLSYILKELQEKNPLPTWPQIQSLQTSLSFTIRQLNETMTLHAKTLREAHAYPLPTFPGHREGDFATVLLRKKAMPPVEEWIKRGTKPFEDGVDDGLGTQGFEALWSGANGWREEKVGPLMKEGIIGANYTITELHDMQKEDHEVQTGLRRTLDVQGRPYEESSDEEDEDVMEEDSVEEDVMPKKKEKGEEGVDPELRPLPLEGVLRFVTTGAVPVRPNR